MSNVSIEQSDQQADDTTMGANDRDVDFVNEIEVAAEFHVVDDASANWFIRKVNEARAYSKRCAEWCEREQCRAKRTEEFFLGRYGYELEQWARGKIAAESDRRKSVNLPAGTVGFRTQRSTLVIDNENEVLAWVKKANPALVAIVERLSKSALNEHFEQTGELPPAGAHVEPEREKFYIK